MTIPDAMELLKRKVAELGQAEVGRQLGYSSGSIICQILKGDYKGAPTNALNRVVELFGGVTAHCPVLGEITLQRCAEQKKLPFSAANPRRAQLYRACKTCERRGK